MKKKAFFDSWLQTKVQKAESEKRQTDIQDEKIQFFEEKITSIRESIYQPLVNLVAEMNEELSKQGNETIKKQKVQITPLKPQKNRYVSFDIIDGESQLNFEFEIIFPENYTINTCKRLSLELDYLNARDCNVYPNYNCDNIIWWGIISGNAGMGLNVIYCEKQNSDQKYIKIVKKEAVKNDGIPHHFQTYDELYKKAMYGWYQTTSNDYNLEEIMMLIKLNDFWQLQKK